MHCLASENYHGSGAFSKWNSRWSSGIWSGREERNDEHLVLVDGRLQRFRCVRRVPAAHANLRWQEEKILGISQHVYEQKGSTTKPLDQDGPRAKNYVPVAKVGREFEPTPGCSACARKGQYAHGFHHSLACRHLREEWQHRELVYSKKRQLEHPQIRLEEDIDVPMGGTPSALPASTSGPPSSSVSSSATRTRISGKRPCPDDAPQRSVPDDIEGKRARVLEVLAMEATDDADQREYVQLEQVGLWWPKADCVAGDLRELAGLAKRGVLEPTSWSAVTSSAQVIRSRMVRRPKGELIKSRLVVQDLKSRWQPEGGELFAATPVLGVQRLLLALGSFHVGQDESYRAGILDVTQAFTHAPLEEDEELVILLPGELHGLEIPCEDGSVWVIDTSVPHRVRRALYG